MKPKKRQKLCLNCEGDVDVDVIVCPFCAADLREEKPEQRYAPYVSATPPKQHSPEVVEAASSKESGDVLPTILLTVGVQLLLFSLLMLFFSHKGVVIVKWDAKFWFVYLLASVPFLVFGYKSFSKDL